MLRADGPPALTPGPMRLGAPPRNRPAVTQAAWQRWDLLLVCVAVFLAFDVGRIHQLFPQLIPFRPILVSAVAATILYLANFRDLRRLQALKHPIAICVLAILAMVALSVPFSLSPSRSLQFLYTELAKTVVLFLLVAGCVRSFRDVERLAQVYLFAAVIYGAVVYARGSRLSSGRLNDLYTYDSNDFALFMVVALPLAFYHGSHARGKLRVLVASFAILVLGVGVVASGSRGGFLAGAGLLLFYVFASRTTRLAKRLAVVGVVVVVTLLAAQGWYWLRMKTLFSVESDYNVTTEYGRVAIWKRGIGYMVSRPFTGVGAANFGKAEGTISEVARQRAAAGKGTPWKAPHNSFVQMGAELGVPGLGLLLALLGFMFAALRRAGAFGHPGRDPPQAARGRALAFALAGSLVGWTIGAFFLSQAYASMLYALAGLVLGLAKLQRHAPEHSALARAERHPASGARPPRSAPVIRRR